MINAKDLPDAIQWHEGLLLAPQHFQQLALRQEQLLAYHVLAGLPFSWGVREVGFDGDMLGAGTLRVSRIEAIMPDGQVVSRAQGVTGESPLELELEPFAERLESGELKIYLAVAHGPDRFNSVAGELVVDELADSEPIEIPRLVPKLQLLAGDAPSSRYVSFPLATIRRENGVFKLGDFVPPLICLSREMPLWQSCNALAARMREKSVFLAKQTSVPSSGIEDRLQFLEVRDRLRSVVELLPYYEAVLGTDSVHPYPLYLALSSLFGPLSLLRPGSVPPAPVPYRHMDLHSSFDALLAQVGEMLEAVSQTYREIKFTLDNGAFSLMIDPQWMGERLVVGARGPSEREILAWMDGALIGSDTVLGGLREKRILGAARSRIERADELGLAGVAGMTLFTIRADAAFVVPGRPLIIANRNESAGAQRPAEIILYVTE